MFSIKLALLICLGILFYSYIGYWILISVLVKFFGSRKIPPQQADEDLPDITLIIACYNEAPILEEKILNSLQLDYPPGKKKIIFVTDGSTDESLNILSRYPEISHLHHPERKGKVTAMHRAVGYVTSPIVVFSDANTFVNREALREITRHYQDPNTGGVAGEKKVLSARDADASASEGLYWKYESSLKKKDAQLYSVVGAAGELFSVRTELYEDPGSDAILDDFVISLRICQKGYRIAYAPEAFALEEQSSSLAEEKKRKIRISAGGFQSIVMLKGLLNIFKYPVLSFQYISHRVLRWAVCPFLFPLAFILNLYIALTSDSIFFRLIMGCQLLFYASAIVGWYLSRKKIKISVFFAAYYLAFINICLYKGLARYLGKKQTVLWDKAQRKRA